jgi:hypothetical protein
MLYITFCKYDGAIFPEEKQGFDASTLASSAVTLALVSPRRHLIPICVDCRNSGNQN